VTKEFKVFKLLVQKPNWVEVETNDRLVLGDGALFLDDNASIYVSAAASKFFGCHSNSIYFTDDYVPSNTCSTGVCPSTPYKVVVFNLEDGSFQWRCVSKFMFSRKSKSRPTWIRPTFQGKLPTWCVLVEKVQNPLKKQTLLLDGLFILKKRERSSLLYLSSMVAGPFATCKLL
jgi:hypothetical protein